MSDSNICLLFLVVLWAVTLYLYWKKKKAFDSGFCLLSSYLVYSVFSILLYNNESFSDFYNEITFFPFVYLYLAMIVTSWPVLQYDIKKIKYFPPANKFLLNSISYIIILCALLNLPSAIIHLREGLFLMFLSSTGGQELYQEMIDSGTDAGGTISNIPSIISNAFTNIAILFLFYHLTQKKKSKFLIIGLSISVISNIMHFLSTGQRGGVVLIILTILITYFAIKDFLGETIKKTIRRVGLVFIVLITIPLVAITISRFAYRDTGVGGSFFDYIGQANLNFNNYGLDNGGIRYGDRTFPLFKRMLGFENVPKNFWERRNKYSNLHISDQYFITYVGDFTLDFGPFVAAIIMLLFSLFVTYKTKIRNHKFFFEQLILLHFVMCITMQGGMELYTFSDVQGNLRVIVVALCYISFKLFRIVKTNNKSLNYGRSV